MRKLVVAFAAGCVIASGAAWYVLSYLPDQIRAEIDASIASLHPRVLINYQDVDIDILKRKALFTGVTVQEYPGGTFGDAGQMTVTSGSRDDEYDVLLENVSFTASKNPGDKFRSPYVHLDGLSLGPEVEESEAADLAFLRRLKLHQLTVRKIEDVDNKLKISEMVLDGLSDAKFAKAAITGIHGKDKEKLLEFSVAGISAEKIDILEIATLPKTFRGQPDWTKLNTGKISIDRARAKFRDTSISVGETLSDGINSGRIVRFRLANAKIDGVAKKGDPFSVGLEKFEMNNFPIISSIPTSLEKLQSFQAQHKNLIYDGFDIRKLKIATAEASFEIHSATFPKPVFRKTPSGAQYAAKGQISMDIRGDFSGFKNTGKKLNPIVPRIFKDLKGQVILSVQTTGDHEKKSGTIETMEINIPGVARLQMSTAFGNLPLRYFEAPNDPIVQQITMRQITLGALDLTLVNEGLAETLLEAAADKNRTSASAFAQKLAVMVRATVTADGSAEGLAIANEIGKFLRDPRSLRLTLKPTRTLPIITLGNPQLLQSAGQVSKILGLKIEANTAGK